MASNAPPPPPSLDPPNTHFFSFTEPPLQPAFAPSTNLGDHHTPIHNHDRSLHSGLPPAPPPPSSLITMPPTSDRPIPPAPNTQAPPETGEQARLRASSDPGHHSESGDGSESDGEDGGEDENEEQDRQARWLPIPEDKSQPCEDELAYITQRGEHSALDYSYWEKKIFFDLEDPELYPIASGRIDWTVDGYNGTKEKPNEELIMRSPPVRIGGYDWCIKFYPKGNDSDYLSLYLECVTMQSDDFEASKDFSNPALPFLASCEKLRLRTSEAVQLGIVMYNPAEPRVYEHKIDAHQFTKQSSDYGWTRFTRYARPDFAFRMHGQRQAILRDDKLAFSAYVRLVHDPTRCMWAHGTDCYNDSVTLTGLRPFAPLTPMYSAKLPLLHFAPLRGFICKSKDVKMAYWLQCLLWKMMSRTRSDTYGEPANGAANIPCDAVAWLRHVAIELKKDTNPSVVDELIGDFNPDQGAAVGANRLRTKTQTSIQSAVDSHPTSLATPALLTLELERAEFDRKERKWSKLSAKVEMQNRIIVNGKPYILYAFSTHCGDLTSNKFKVYIRPNGPQSLWYAYSDGDVTAMTWKQAVDAHCGVDLAATTREARQSSSRHRKFLRFDDVDEVAHVVYYVRDDYRHFLTDTRVTEEWDVPENVKLCEPPKQTCDRPAPAQTGIGPGEMSAEMERHIIAATEKESQKSTDAVTGGATPSAWITDGEDIIMSDGEAMSARDTTDGSDFLCTGCTIEHLGREYYRGSLLGNRYHGEGHLISMNGDEYTGAFVAGEKCGFGKMVYARTGNVYEGQWLQDQHHGTGTLTEAKTKNVYEGGWKHGKKSGEFVLKGHMTEEDKGWCSICYDKEINTAFYDCGHVLACRDCAFKIDQCPVCRRRVVGRLELFGVKMVFE
ncbi:hypothetical protein BDY17DRAFT_130485 [Neohortaea acidophila]|uniref:RING-type domain-containing protein n=1 Tax=Neohortaea acidophila TaxID=245834 RepID=A0A6A6PZE5_9PEZI|nr:uncharacterized protein BDY17DRAFT_130485 [Neohortaea acidophila]KAF2484537.1 hypothetical protein BDY17DRAFT_130485 [Neohortaea acidophila]